MTGVKTNFSMLETGLLVNLIDKYRSIIECKITNAFHNKKKDDAWVSLTKEFNTENGVCFRSVKQLKNKYKNMKKESQKKKSIENGLYSEGGGILMLKSRPLDENACATVANIKVEPVEPPNQNEQDFAFVNTIENNQASRTVYHTDEMTVDNDTDKTLTVNENISQLQEPGEDSDQEYITPSLSLRNIYKGHRVPLKRKWNFDASKKASEALTEGAKARKTAVETESAQIKKIREAEHQFKKEEHELKMKVLEAKLHYYNLLSIKLNSDGIILK